MGQVFSWEAVRNKKVPKTEDFLAVVSRLRSEIAESPFVLGALLCGSVVRGDFNVRSDIDCVVIYEVHHEIDAVFLMHRLDRDAHARHVPINFVPFDAAVVKTRMHWCPPSFMSHLRSSIERGGIIKGDPLAVFAQSVQLKPDIESYLAAKMYNLQEALCKFPLFNEDQLILFVKKALEAPVHVARKVLAYRGIRGIDSKQNVRRAYQMVMPWQVGSAFDSLVELDSWYSAELSEQLENRDAARYAFVMKTLIGAVPRVIAFLRENIIYIQTACE